MSGSEWRPARWTPGPLEERRLAAAALPRRGRLTQAAIARRLGVSRASVSRWAAAVRQRGRRGLRARPKTGRPPRLGARAWARLGRLLESGAVAAGFGTERWTLKRIATLIRREFGVRHHPRYLERPLKAHGFTVQRPATRAKERDEPAIVAWPRREWVAIKKAGPPCGAHAAVPRRDRPQLPAAAGHHLGSPRGDAAAAAPEPAARGPQHRRGHPRRPAVCAARPRQRLEPDGDPGPAALPAEGRRAAPRGPGPPQRAPRAPNGRLPRRAAAGLRGGLPAGLRPGAQPRGAVQRLRQARHGERATRLRRRPAPSRPARVPPSPATTGTGRRLLPARRPLSYATSVKIIRPRPGFSPPAGGRYTPHPGCLTGSPAAPAACHRSRRKGGRAMCATLWWTG